MKWLEISKDTFLYNMDDAKYTSKYNDCFAKEIGGRLYLYVDNGDKYILDIYDRTLEEIFSDDMFFECMAIWMLDAERHITDLLHWFASGRDINKMPFGLEDIHYCEYDG